MTGLGYAVKILMKQLLEKHQGVNAFKAEVLSFLAAISHLTSKTLQVENLKRVDGHVNVIRLVEVIEEADAYFCFLELASNGELNEYIGTAVAFPL